MNDYKKIKILGIILLIFSFISLILSIYYELSSNYTIFWDILGIFFMVTLVLNIICSLVLLSNPIEGKMLPNGFRVLLSGNLIFIIIGMLLNFLGNFIPLFPDASMGEIILNFVLVDVTIFGMIIITIIIAYLIFIKTEKIFATSTQKEENRKRINIIFSKIFILIISLLGIILIVPIITKPSYGFFAWIGVFSASAGLSFFFVYLSFSALSISNVKFPESKKFGIAGGLIMLIIAGVFITPLLTISNTISNANRDFSAVYDGDFSEAEGYFMKTPFSIPNYFFNYPITEVDVERNVLYFNGSESSYNVDTNVTLFFDVYMPKNKGTGLPGQNSTIIRIHGGGWSIGDKGLGNIGDQNKYLAAQGYIVFDIQYGLTNQRWNLPLITPENVLANFTIDDMIRHIGNFTFYLANNAEKYGANLNSVFISGGSAGGQLTCATALAIHNGNYTDIFSDQLIIKGLIPYYPANFINREEFIPGSPEFLNPELLIDEEEPPCLIYQGTHDGMVNPMVSQSFKNAYNTKHNDCVIIWFPLAGHAADLYFPGYFNLVFLFYMERFLYLNK